MDFKSNEQKWTIHGILQHMGFSPPTENPCVMMRENVKNSCEYIAICQDDLYFASQTPEEIVNILQDKYNININPDSYLRGKYPHDPGGKMIFQLRKYLEKVYVNVTILFNTLMNLTGAPAHCWLLCLICVHALLTITASPALNGKTPDISHFLHF